jgi:deoxyhypusine synthase
MAKISVKDIQIKKRTSSNELIKALYDSGGFTAKKVAVGTDILENMIKQKNCLKILSFPACICSTGTRGVIKELIKRKYFDIVITTAGTLDHDLARLWKNYYHGSFVVDDKELHKQGVNRLGNIFIPNESYGIILEKKMQPILSKIYKIKQRWSTKEIIWEFGKHLEKEKNHENSIIYWSWKNKIPVFIPGITDGAFGSQIWMYYQNHRDFTIDILKDEQDLSDLLFNAKKTGALIIGGGISKHHVIWWSQFTNGLDYAVYITTAQEYDGSLSGAKTREAISWGKIKEKSDNVTIDGDATIILPLMISALAERI